MDYGAAPAVAATFARIPQRIFRRPVTSHWRGAALCMKMGRGSRGPFVHPQKKKLLLVMILPVLALLAAAGGFFWYQSQKDEDAAAAAAAQAALPKYVYVQMPDF